jgi:hypothetical protein
MLSRPRSGSGETEVPLEALVEPSLGHAVLQGEVSTVDSRGVITGAVVQSRARARRSFLRG